MEIEVVVLECVDIGVKIEEVVQEVEVGENVDVE